MSFADLIAGVDRAVLGHLGGSTIVYQPEGGAAVEVQGMFDPAYVVAEQGNAGVEGVRPAVWVLLADLPGDPRTDRPIVTANGIRYKVTERRTDGQLGGSVVLILKRVEA